MQRQSLRLQGLLEIVHTHCDDNLVTRTSKQIQNPNILIDRWGQQLTPQRSHNTKYDPTSDHVIIVKMIVSWTRRELVKKPSRTDRETNSDFIMVLTRVLFAGLFFVLKRPAC